ncbi:MAG: site-2 protease family protein [Pyrinomonadaceae bacterium]
MRYLEFFKRQMLLTHIGGIPIKIDYRWFLVFIFITWLMAQSLLMYVNSGLAACILGLLVTLSFFVSVLLHELAHALAAKMEAVEVVEIVLHPFGGLARMRRAPDTPRAEFRIALAGPAASFLLAIGFFILMAISNALGLTLLAPLFFFIASMNFLLAIFNLFPGYPLDGGRVFRAYLWKRGKDLNEATALTGRLGQIIALVLVVFGILTVIFASNVFTGLWTILVGLFLYDAAKGIIKQINNLENLIVEDVMQLPVSVEPDSTVLQFVDQLLPLHRQTVFPVANKRQFYGFLMLEDMKKLPRDDWSKTKILDVMRPVTTDFFVEHDFLYSDAKQMMRGNGIGALGVIDKQGNLVGFLQRGKLKKND